MKKLLLTAVLAVIGTVGANAQLLITNATYTEGFNSATATVPTNWTASGFAGTGAAITYNGTLTNNNTYYAMLPTSGSTNNAFGGKLATTGPNATLTLSAVNNTGSDISEFALSFDYLQYTTHNRASTLVFSYSLDGSTFISTGLSFSTGGISYTATQLTGVNTGNASWTSAILTQSNSASLILPTALANNEDIFFRFTWATGAGGGNNAHLGIDNFSLTAVPEPSTYALIGMGLVGLVAFRRIKKSAAA